MSLNVIYFPAMLINDLIILYMAFYYNYFGGSHSIVIKSAIRGAMDQALPEQQLAQIWSVLALSGWTVGLWLWQVQIRIQRQKQAGRERDALSSLKKLRIRDRLQIGKHSTNELEYPSLKGNSRAEVGFQKAARALIPVRDEAFITITLPPLFFLLTTAE